MTSPFKRPAFTAADRGCTASMTETNGNVASTRSEAPSLTISYVTFVAGVSSEAVTKTSSIVSTATPSIAMIISPGCSVDQSAGSGLSIPTTGSSVARPAMPTKTAKMAIDMIKLNTGPAATVAARAPKGAPGIVLRRSASVIVWTAPSPPTEAAFASPLNLT